MDSLKSRIQEDMKAAMRAREKGRLGVIRLILAEIKQVEVDTRQELEEAELLSLLAKMIKQRRESQAQYESADRPDLAEKEGFEIEIIEGYLPAPLDEAEVDRIVEEAIEESGARSVKEMGKVMALLKPRLAGRADMGAVSGRVRALLQARGE